MYRIKQTFNNTKKNINYKILVISLFHFIVTFFTDKLIFQFNSYFNYKVYYLIKVVLLFLLVILWQLFYIKLKNYKKDKFLKYFLLYFIPMIILLFMVWPGNWSGSDVHNFLHAASTGNLVYYLNYLTTVFYAISFMIIPVPCAAIIMQIFLLSAVFSYIMNQLFLILKTKKYAYLMIIPFVSINVIFFNFYSNRPIIQGILMLYLMSYIMFTYLKNIDINNSRLILISALTGVISFFRTETIYFLIAIPLIIYFGCKNKKLFIKTLIFSTCFMLLLSIPQRIGTANNKSVTRNIPSFINPLSYMMQFELKGENIEVDLEHIGKVISIESLKKYPSVVEITAMILDSDFIKSQDEEDYKQFFKSYLNIIVNNKYLFIKARFLTFAHSTNVAGNSFCNCGMSILSHPDFFNKYNHNEIINLKLRKNILSFLEMRYSNTHEEIKLLTYTNNLALVFGLIIILFFVVLIKKHYVTLGIIVTVGLNAIIVFFLAPAAYFMYYYGVYLVSLFLLFLYLIIFLDRKNINIDDLKFEQKKCLLLGYLKLNLGDDLFFKIIAEKFTNTDFYIYPPSNLLTEYKKVFKKNKNIHFYDNKKLYKSLRQDIPDENTILNMFPEIIEQAKNCDATIFIGGSLFSQNNNYKDDDFFKILSVASNKPTYVLGCNFGPGDKKHYLHYLNTFKDLKNITFRESKSYKRFKTLNNADFYPDIVFGLKRVKKNQKKKNSIGISVINLENRKELYEYKNNYEQKIMDLIVQLIDKGKEVTLISFCKEEGDEKAIQNIKHNLTEKYRDNVKTLYYHNNIDDFLSEYASFNHLICTRLHSTILGLTLGIPCYSIAYSDKISNILDDIFVTKDYIEISKIKELNYSEIERSLYNQIRLPRKIRKESIKHFQKLEEDLN